MQHNDLVLPRPPPIFSRRRSDAVDGLAYARDGAAAILAIAGPMKNLGAQVEGGPRELVRARSAAAARRKRDV